MVNEEMMDNMKDYRKGMRRKAFFIVPMVLVAIALVGGVVMLLWNAIVPQVFTTVHEITYWQALGLLLLCKILFSSFGGKRGGWAAKRRMHMAWKEKWMGMSEEEKAKFKQEWKDRCQGRC